jgi:hypothetical protein
MLAAMRRTIIEQDCWVIAQDDIRDAFPSARIADAVSAFSRFITDPRTLRLVEIVLCGNDSERSIGLDQGNPLSPLALLIILHYCLDAHQSVAGYPSWLRYVDNLVWLCHDAPQGRQTIERADQLLGANGFHLKRNTEPADLRVQGSFTELLGFQISARNGQVRFGVGNDAYAELRHKLGGCHSKADAPGRAKAVIGGWLSYFGPAYEDAGATNDVLCRVRQTAREQGFRELPMDMELLQLMNRSQMRWRRLDGQEPAQPGIVGQGANEVGQDVRASVVFRAPRESNGSANISATPIGPGSGPGADGPPF